MNPFTDFLFTVSWFALLVWAIRSIIKGWSSKPVQEYNANYWTKQVTKRIHPEMIDVEPGEELMGVTFESKSCDIEDYNELQERIAKLKDELEDDDDDEGGTGVLTNA
tara:strand:+ start:682 stop:1005 length:324 start_codon:yes stop_codon:yes gene_type:complete